MDGQIRIDEIYIAKPIDSEDIKKFCVKFCKKENNNFVLISNNQLQEPMQELEDENNNKEYYSKNYFIQQFIKNKHFIYSKCSGLKNIEDLCDMNDDALIDLDYLILIEKTINDIFLQSKIEQKNNYKF